VKNRTHILVMLVLLAIITFLDRISIAVAGPRIQAELGISPERWGWVLGAFVLAYGVFEIPTGAFGDRFGQGRVITRIVLWWSAFTALTGMATGFGGLVAIRFLFGAGEAGAYPNAAGVIARNFPVREHARSQGFIWAASRFGGALAPLLVVPLQAALGWRAAFWILGGVGVVWAAVWAFWYRDPPVAAGVRHVALPWRVLAGNSQIRIIVAMYWCYAWGSWFFFAWFPTYLVKSAGFSEKEMGWIAALPFLMGTLGNLVGGVLSDRLVARWGLRLGRIVPGSVSLAVSAVLLVAMTMTHQKAWIVVLSSLGFGVADLMLPVAWAICLDIGRDYAGAVTGTMNTAGQLGGFVCSVAFGYVVQATGSYSVPVWIIAGLVMTAAVLFTRIDPTRVLVAPRQAA
jgi:ACS family glucarate transporter-like MFS transporter